MHDELVSAGAPDIASHDWNMALRPGDGLDAYLAVREHVGISDFSDQGKLRVRGEAARDLLESLLTGNVRNTAENTMRMMLALDEAGGIIAEVLLSSGFDDYVLQTDAASLPALKAMILAACRDEVVVEDVSDTLAVLRVDGFEAADLPRRILGLEAAGLRLMGFAECLMDGTPVTVGRLGSAGEYAYQFIAPRDAIPTILERIRAALPKAALCGQSVFDLLHLEMRAFNGRRDLPFGESCLAAGLHWMIDFHKPEFPGRDRLLAMKADLPMRMVCLRMSADAPVPSVGQRVMLEQRDVGYVANAAFSPLVKSPIALAYLDRHVAVVGIPLRVGEHSGMTVSAPFVRTRSNTLRHV